MVAVSLFITAGLFIGNIWISHLLITKGIQANSLFLQEYGAAFGICALMFLVLFAVLVYTIRPSLAENVLVMSVFSTATLGCLIVLVSYTCILYCVAIARILKPAAVDGELVQSSANTVLIFTAIASLVSFCLFDSTPPPSHLREEDRLLFMRKAAECGVTVVTSLSLTPGALLWLISLAIAVKPNILRLEPVMLIIVALSRYLFSYLISQTRVAQVRTVTNSVDQV